MTKSEVQLSVKVRNEAIVRYKAACIFQLRNVHAYVNWNLLCCNIEVTNVKHGWNEGIVHIYIRIGIHSTICRCRHNLSVTLASVILNFQILNRVAFIF